MGQKFIPKFKKSAKWYCKEIHSSKTIRPGKRQASQQQCVGAVTAFSNGFFASQVNVMISGKYPWLRNSFAIQKKIGVTFTSFSQIILLFAGLRERQQEKEERQEQLQQCQPLEEQTAHRLIQHGKLAQGKEETWLVDFVMIFLYQKGAIEICSKLFWQ